ncbi:homeobox transcription factor, putative [Talaromyces stipitatus ATCC 10500]|uniref:Homeobox transcription factor, putative n=1 Tax=Talaromyces stipitatus (strain ATCC 10500 / CBS 375.48 / QM 6759 / NRRL 1006) TaxID=441959 RepID=B8LW72_TALSN|nr:homeobox transcription factor, putative [Talaromyces stipitatus ATCC 10500]EED24100.1 homeobox transcription factor, putative [Talaromyces stipitatus ATCC 10500]
MNFLHHPTYPYGGHAGIPLDQSGIAHPAMTNNMDGYLLTRPAYDLTDYYAQMPIMEDYEEYAENLSRPRLTKEQVDTLEAQFQAHPKPNSNKKRELAVQTNLSLPRVANWFQNRRAKAKQQKRQEEFERMQREAKEKDEQAKPIKEEESGQALPDCDQKSPIQKDEDSNSTTKSPTPTQASHKERPQDSDPSSTSRPKHQKTRSDLAQEKTYASLQRAISAAEAARARYTGPSDGPFVVGSTVDMAYDVQQSNISVSSTNNTPQTSANSTFSEWGSSRDSPIVWTPSQSPEDGYEFGSLSSVPFSSEVPQLNNSSPDVSGPQGFSSMTSRAQQLWNPQLHVRAEIHASDPMYGSLSFSSLQPPSASSSRRPSASEELADTINGIGINTAPLSGNLQSSMWRHPEKELDLAARRKRPRPAAIGTAHHRLATNPSIVSPNARMASYGAPHTIRHAKSSHTLGSRYAGVRKLSATQRSPLGYSSFAEAATAAANAGSDSRQKHRLHSSASVGNLAPPTPLTPEDMQQMLPATTNDTQMSFSTQHLTDSHSIFPVTQPMQINVASPPETPMTMDMFSAMQYQNMPPPLSAPPQYGSFTDYSPITSEPLTGVSWAVSTPDTSLFPSSMQSQQQQPQPPIYIYEQDDDEQQDTEWALSGEDGSSLYGSTKASATPPASMMTVSEEQNSNGMTQFHIHEFPKQQEAHRNVAQQLAPQIPKNYTFSNQTPSDF